MYIFTNRVLADKANEEVFGRAYRPDSSQLGVALVKRGAGETWNVSGLDRDVSNQDLRDRLVPLFEGKKPVLVYLHGNNNTPASCFERCQKLEDLYGVEVVGFSWPSEGYLSDGESLSGFPEKSNGKEDDLKKVTKSSAGNPGIKGKVERYKRASSNAKESVESLSRFLGMVGSARLFANKQPFSIAAHSLGAQFLQYALVVPGCTEAIGTAYNIAFLAPCVRASGHRDWLATIHPKNQVFVTYNKGDSVLASARFADGDSVMSVKLGGDLTADRLVSSSVRYIEFTDAGTNFGGHGYFIKRVSNKAKVLFTRIFSSRPDLKDGESTRNIYVDCDETRQTCRMGSASNSEVKN
jgi:Alpha/beta hydrolase of unknown function (DUF900)